MDQHRQRAAAQEFVERWRGRGDEKQDTQAFWSDLLVSVLGVAPARLPSFVSFERKVQGGYIDVFMEDAGVLVEQKSLSVGLDKRIPQSNGSMLTPFEQAVNYKAKLADPIKPRWIVTSNFEAIRVYDQAKDATDAHPEVIELEDLPEEAWRLGFITDKRNSRIERERRLSVEAGERVGRLYGQLSRLYLRLDESPEEQESLNVLVVRLVFLLFAEDAGLLQAHDAFRDYLSPIPPDQLRQALIDLFRVLDTPEERRDPYLPESLLAFPYVNGGIFADESIVIPRLDLGVKLELFEASGFDWRQISPTIFGAVFESTLNPETRRQGGMHYTSVENIHRVIDPLFLDNLRRELEQIEGLKTERARVARLRAFQRKLGAVRVLDPACGSGNFLTESYLSLRRLENRALSTIMGEGQMGLGFGGELDPIQVTLDQFFGIEVNDFAVAVARTALWIAEFQMKAETQELLWLHGGAEIEDLPLTSNPHVVHGNALRMDWNDVLPASECGYVCGNPPFVGYSNLNAEQQEDMRIVFSGYKRYGKLDYVAAWYAKAVEYMQGTPIRAAFVSTNSICQGESVRILWEQLFARGVSIEFAWPTFIWDSEASEKAHVHVVIIGFTLNEVSGADKVIHYEDGPKHVHHINGYLVDGPDVFIQGRGRPLNPGVPKMTKGNQPTGKGLILSVEEAEALISRHADLSDVIRPYIGGREFVHGTLRYCLWFVGVDHTRYLYPEIIERLEQVRLTRLSSSTASVRADAETPWLFTQIRQPSTNYLVIPEVSGERRRYIPIGYLTPDIIASNKLMFIPTDDLYIFGLLASKLHMAWMRMVTGRLKSDYSYSPSVWNSFIFPEDAETAHEAIVERAKAVLDARESYQGCSLETLYDPDNEMRFPRLYEAQRALDAAVETAYGVDFAGDEEKIVAHLFKLYAAATG